MTSRAVPPHAAGNQKLNIGHYWLQRPSSNRLFQAPIHEGFPLLIWFGNILKRFLRSFVHSALTNKPKSTRKYLLDLEIKFLFLLNIFEFTLVF